MAKTRAEFDEHIAGLRRKKEIAVRTIADAFAQSAAVIVTEPKSMPELWILSGNMGPDKRGHRVTYFGKDGPIGHIERDTLNEVWEELYRPGASFQPVGDAEVIAWTSTPEFERGSRRVAYIQALNQLGWLISQAVTIDDKRALMEAQSKAQSMEDEEKATAFLGRVIHAFSEPRKNPSRRNVREGDFDLDLTPNPTPWVTHVLAQHYPELEEQVPPAWLPKIAKTRAVGSTFTGELSEFGCGAFGCVLPTLDQNVVLKVTSDESEAEFAMQWADKLPTPVTTAYYMAVKLEGSTRGPRSGVRHDGLGEQIYLLWREEAKDVGKIDTIVGQHAEAAIHRQHSLAMEAFIKLARGEDARAALERWRFACKEMQSVPELIFVSEGLLRAEAEAKVFISDTHGGNLGRCMRNGRMEWVITDPGNVVVLREPSAARRSSR